MCDFAVVRLADVSEVTLELDIVGDKVIAAYDGREYELMTIAIDSGSISKVTFVATQPSQTVAAEGRLWCINDDEPWEPWESSGNVLSYSADVPAEVGDVGYEFRFALASQVKAGSALVWKDPKLVISRVGGLSKAK